ncbi:CRISPR-associated endonuclease Cas2 [Methanospirillum sp. J.3.6.1-F.2.7.3]|uniref:CRISPR-associated endoribonuclease Cas2 n=1 Tax=Methanospirillum purgamenti TaxID=2834276 RepID=A0A8E7AYL0_9EURY|nr:CRISPR-associated endonuclease Cas2 [Methanospirillum sp. J.3.6.1-F.2.7.3]MDX8551916.1 CRISPR-associated endonuclease Cas2 [Methanospirillum hungatei]QVV89840.1 CRISPR-associated endonuclease Cas2 [Methanospirillum sp. J.3.6.1-F.2.7.3]
MKHLIVCYDVEKTKDRNKVIKVLEYYGLKRIQYSVFMGSLTDTRLHQMNTRIKREFTKPSIKILVIEVCNACMERALLVHEELPKVNRKFEVI